MPKQLHQLTEALRARDDIRLQIESFKRVIASMSIANQYPRELSRLETKLNQLERILDNLEKVIVFLKQNK